MHSARAIATRCCWPPESWLGYLSACSGMRTRVEVLHRRRLGLLACSCRASASAPACSSAATVRCGNRLNCWNTMPTSRAHRVDVALAAGGEVDAVDDDAALLHRLEPVDAADQRRLARARRPADRRCARRPRTARSMSVSTWNLPNHLSTAFDADDRRRRRSAAHRGRAVAFRCTASSAGRSRATSGRACSSSPLALFFVDEVVRPP